MFEGSSHLDGTSRSTSRDEIEDEQAEAELRNKLNKEFQNFIKRVEEVSAQSGTELEFDIPYPICYSSHYIILYFFLIQYIYRDLGFWGVPFKSNVFLQPTVHCLISLIETPFFVLTLSEIEICSFERVQVCLTITNDIA